MKFKLTFLSLLIFTGLNAQQAIDVLNQYSKVLNALTQKHIQYQSVLAHSDNPRKAERKRQELLNQVTTSRQALAEIPYVNGDKTMHKAIEEFLKLVNYNLNEDYSKLVNMQEIAENSYDKMEAYVMLKEKLNEKMKGAGDSLDQAQKEFAGRHNIKIVDSKSSTELMLDKISKTGNYYDAQFLIFFKAQLLDEQLMEAVKKNDVKNIEQSRSALKLAAEEGLLKLDTMKSFLGDASLVNAGKRAMSFFAKEAERSAEYSEYATAKENFERMKKQFEGDRKMQQDKTAVDNFNAAVNAINKGVSSVNNTNAYLNNYRKETYEYWNNAVKVFFDRHIPVAD